MTLSQDHATQQERRGTDSPPLSRRAARESERRAATGDQSANVHPSGIYDLNASGNIWDTISRRAAAQLTDAASDAEHRTGRRVDDLGMPPEPLSYVPPARPTVPSYSVPSYAVPSDDGASFSNRVAAEAVGPDPATSLADRSTEVGGVGTDYRPRDFAPRTELVADSPVDPVDPASAPLPTPARSWNGSSARRDARTPTVEQFTPPLLAAALPAEPDRLQSAAGVPDLERTLTRRELRAMQARSTADGAAAFLPSPALDPAARGSAATDPAAADSGVQAWSPGLPASSVFTPYSDTATVQMSALDRAEMLAEQSTPTVISEPLVAEPLTAAWSAELVETVVAETVDPADAEPADRFGIEELHDTQPRTTPSVTGGPLGDGPLTGLQGFEALIAQASAGRQARSVPATAPLRVPQEARVERPFTPPVGHWSLPTQEEDGASPFSGLLSRNVATPGGSTNALIMPHDPQPSLLQAVNSTGEILVTGSLDLPRSLSATGAPSENYDSSEIDRLFEAAHDEHPSDVVPVRASRAVSGHTSTRSVVGPRRRGGGTLPTVLAITAALMAIGVIGLLFGGYVLRIF